MVIVLIENIQIGWASEYAKKELSQHFICQTDLSVETINVMI